MKLSKAAMTVCCIAVTGAALAQGASADDWNKKTSITFRSPKAKAMEMIKTPVLFTEGGIRLEVAEPVNSADATVVVEVNPASVMAIKSSGEEVQPAQVVTTPSPAEMQVATELLSASSFPLIALLGLLALSMALALRVFEKRLQWRPLSNKSPGFLICAGLSLCLAPLSVMAQSVRAPVNLGTAGNYVILSKAGITDVPPSAIVGNIGASPITGAAIHVTCAEVTGTIYSVDAAGPAPCRVTDPVDLGTAIGDMATAYTDAAGRTIPDFTDLGAGNISGKTLVPGLYKWGTDVIADNTGFTLSGGPNAVWIFQIAGNLTLANSAHVTLAGGAQATNIFWQIGGGSGLTLGTGAVFYGNALSATAVIMNTGASLIGRALAVTDVTLAMSPVTSPGTLVGGLPVIVGPTVTSTAPANHALNVPVNSALSATFSEAMNPSTITSSTFTLYNGLTSISGTVSYVGVTATFIPSANLPTNTTLTATITTGAHDPAGVALAANYVWTFTTAASPNLTPPTVSSTVPANGATNVPIGNALSATFSEAINPLTITTATFTVNQGATPVTGTVSYAGVTATFTPTGGSFAVNLPFTATITTGVQDLSGNALAANYVWTFTTGAAPDLTPPTVSSTVPASGAAIVPIGNALSATFSKAINPLTITTATFILHQGSTAVAGAVTYAGVTATFTPTSALAPNLPFTATITTGVQDLSGNALAANYVWTFTTGAAPNLTPPTVISTAPAGGATNVPIGNALAATFSEAINPLTITTATFTLRQGATPVPGTVSYAGVTATFTPASALAPNLPFTATITTGVQDLSGNFMAAAYGWTFTTGATPDTTPPTVISTVPANGATLVTTTANIVANFSKLMNPVTISTATFIVKQGTTPIPGTVTYVGTSATFRPGVILAPNTVYNAMITTGAADLAGNLLAGNYLWSFTTGSSTGQTPVCLANFAILAGSAVIGDGSSIVTGDIGVSPGASVTGFPPGTLNGTIHAGDATAAQAMAGFTAAYADALSRSVGPVSVAGDLGGQTFTAGLYRSAASLQISSGNLTLDAKGNANAVFIFQVSSTLTTAGGNQIILVGGAQAFNVFWQVGTSATLGANSVFNGSILADQSITVGSSAVVNGRLEALNGTVTLQSSFVTSPPPVIAPGGILNAADEAQTVAAGSIATIFGNNLGSSFSTATAYPLPTTLGGSSFTIGTQSAPLYMSSCSQVNLQIPWESAGLTLPPVTATAGDLVSTSQAVAIAPFAPGIFSLSQVGSGQGAVEIAPTAELAGPVGTGSRPVNPGEYIAIFCTGLGPVSNQPATGEAALSNPLSVTFALPIVTIGGVPAQVTYSGLAPGFAGLYQVNAVVPAGAPSGNSVNLVISIGGVTSNTVTIAIQ